MIKVFCFRLHECLRRSLALVDKEGDVKRCRAEKIHDPREDIEGKIVIYIVFQVVCQKGEERKGCEYQTDDDSDQAKASFQTFCIRIVRRQGKENGNGEIHKRVEAENSFLIDNKKIIPITNCINVLISILIDIATIF